MYNYKRVAIMLSAMLMTLQGVNAQPALYTFDGPLYPLGLTTPFNSFSPNSGGPPGFTTTFASSLSTSGFAIADSVTIPPTPFPGMSGQVLQTGIAVQPQILTLSFSSLVTSLTLPFAVNLRPGDPIGYLTITSPTSILSQPSIGGSSSFQGGFITFNDPLGFSTATLSAFTSTNQPIQFAIDNLQVTAVPEPATLASVGAGVLGLGIWLTRSRHQRKGKKLRRHEKKNMV